MSISRARISGKATALGAVLALAVPLTACTGEDGGDPKSPATIASPIPSPTPTPTVDPAVYRQTLNTSLSRLNASLRAVDRAKEGSALDKALGAASVAADTAAGELTATKTPDNAATGNAALATALLGLSENLDSARAPEGRCATSPRVVLGNADSLASVREADASLTGLGYPVNLTLPRTEKAKNRRLGNGTLVKDRRSGGLGRLTVKNGTGTDAVVSLTKGNRTTLTVYVRKNSDTTLRRVSDGSYTVYFTSGADWNSSKKSFSRDCTFQKFDDKAVFKTVQVSGGTQYTILTFSLAQVIGGNATTSDVPSDEFPS